MSLGDRLREERERVGMTQPAMAELIGSTKQTVFRWETGRAFPGADVLEALAAAGVDVLYVVTGQRGGQLLTREEEVLLDNFRHSPAEARAAIKATSAAFAQRPGLKKGKAA